MNNSTTTAIVSPVHIELGMLQATDPANLISNATELARTLANVIKSQVLSTTIQRREYVKVEGWTTLAAMLGVTAREVNTIENDGVYTSVVELVRMNDGAVVSRASAECGSDDEKDRNGKPVWSIRPRYARRSMAQTRATGKACRLAFSWIMKLAGYEATPAEEMQPIVLSTLQPTTTKSKQPSNKQQTETLTQDQHQTLISKITDLQLDEIRVKKWCQNVFKITDFKNLTLYQYSQLIKKLEAFAKQVQKEKENAELLKKARSLGWSGDLNALAEFIKYLERYTGELRLRAKHSDDPSQYDQEMSRADDLQHIVNRLRILNEENANVNRNRFKKSSHPQSE